MDKKRIGIMERKGETINEYTEDPKHETRSATPV